MTSGQDGKEKPFKPNTNFVPKKDKESWGKSREFSKKFCKRCEDFEGAKTTHNTKDCRKYDYKGKLLESYGKSRPNGGNRNNQKPCGKIDSRSFAQALAREFSKILTIAKSTSKSISDTMGMMSQYLMIHPLFEVIGRVAVLQI